MADFTFAMGYDPFSRRNTNYDPDELFDKTLRAAISGNYENELRELSDCINVMNLSNTFDYLRPPAKYHACVMLLHQIFTVRSDYEGMRLLYDLFHKDNSFLGFSRISNIPECFIRQSAFLTACLNSSDDVLKLMIDDNIQNNSSDMTEDFFNVLYLIMISGRYSMVKYFINRYFEK
ncbi:MAG: hypothetical protein ACI4K7_05910, partial [Oscillospiraceae bacterium]